jgi:xylulokinase
MLSAYAWEVCVTGQAVVGVDIGTSSTKGVLVGLDGTIHAHVVREHAVERPYPGHVEMDARIWWEELVDITRELLAAIPEAMDVAAIGVSGMGPCLLLADSAGDPLRPAILYGVDTRATDQIARIEAELGADEVMARGHAQLSSQAIGPKLAWLAEHEPAVVEQAAYAFGANSWLAWKLTGSWLQDHHSASQWWPLYDVDRGAWHEPWVELVCPGVPLPPLAWPGDVAGSLSAPAAAATGLRAGIPVILGTIDAWSEAVSVGAQRPGDLMLMYGSTMFLIATVSSPVTSPALWGTVGAFPGTYSLAGGMATSGAITSWLRDLFGAPGYTTLLDEADAAGIGAHGLAMLPYFAGERTPIQDPDARGVVAGLTLAHNRGDLYRAALEATAFGVRHNIEAMTAAGARFDRIVAVGGGVQGGLWTQIVSDVTGLTQVIPSQTVGASLGAAYLAAAAIADVDIDTWNPPAGIRQPDPAATALYDEAYAWYRALYPATRDLAHALAERQRGAPGSETASRPGSLST